MASPIIIFGLNRTGTTGLLNILKQDLGVTVAYHELNFGSCEINLYRISKKHGDFKTQKEYVSFVNKYKYSDVFIALNGDYEKLKQKEFINFYEFFFYLINHSANTYWAFKLEPQIMLDKIELNKLENALVPYKQVKYIYTKRNFDDYINSVIGLYKKNKKYSTIVDLIYTAEYYHYYRIIEKYLNNKLALQLNFDELFIPKELNSKLKNYLNIINTPLIKENHSIVKNSSAHSTFKLSVRQRVIKLLFKHISPLRSFLLKLIEKRRHKKFKNIDIWNTRIHKAKTNPESLIKSFEGQYEEILIPLIKDKYLN